MTIEEFAENLAQECDQQAKRAYVYRLPFTIQADNTVSEMWSRLGVMVRDAARINKD